MLLPSRTPFASITNSEYETSPFICPDDFISTLEASTVPSTYPWITTLCVFIVPFIFPCFPTLTSLSETMEPSNSPSIYKLHDNSKEPSIFAPAVIMVVFESDLLLLNSLLLLLKIAMVLFAPF